MFVLLEKEPEYDVEISSSDECTEVSVEDWQRKYKAERTKRKDLEAIGGKISTEKIQAVIFKRRRRKQRRKRRSDSEEEDDSMDYRKITKIFPLHSYPDDIDGMFCVSKDNVQICSDYVLTI